MASPPLLILGNVNIELVMGDLDRWPDFGTEMTMSSSDFRAGGAAGTTALALSGLSVDHRLIATVGSDNLGTWLQGEFQPGTTAWTTIPTATTVSVNMLHDGGNVVVFNSTGHLQDVTLDTMIDAIPPATSKSSFALVTGAHLMPSVTAGLSQLLTMLSTMGWTTALSHDRPFEGWTEDTRAVFLSWVRATDCILMREHELRAVMEEEDTDEAEKALVKTLADHQVLVVQRGRTRADGFYQGQMVTAAIEEFETNDPVGYADIFNAAFISSYMAGEGLQVALESGLTVASIAVSTAPRIYGVFVD